MRRPADPLALSGAPLVRPAPVGSGRRLVQSLGLLILLWAPAQAADAWNPLLVDGDRIPGPGVLLRDGRALYPVVELGRRLQAPVGVNRVAGVIVVQGREHRAALESVEGRVYVSQAVLREAFPQLSFEEDGLASRIWTAEARRTAPARGLEVLGVTPSVRGDQLDLAVEVANSGAAEAGEAVLVTLVQPDGRTYAEFRQPLEAPLGAGERRQVTVSAWLTPLRLVGREEAEVELHGLEGGATEHRTLRWKVRIR